MSKDGIVDSFKSPGFFKFTLANIMQLAVMLAMLLNWYGSRESRDSESKTATTIILTQHSQQIAQLQESQKQFSTGLEDIRGKVNILVAIAEEQRKKQK
jgi:hypothetical protein